MHVLYPGDENEKCTRIVRENKSCIGEDDVYRVA